MSSMTLNPYLFFTGNCLEAMNFYKSVLGGDLELHTFAEMMPDSPDGHKIAHANLTGGMVSFMASDGTRTTPYELCRISMALGGTDGEALKKAYQQLSEGGKIEHALAAAPWGGEFGSFTDKFGIDWMVNIGN